MKLDVKWMRYASALSGAVMAKVVMIYAGFVGGTWADEKFGTYPLFLALGTFSAVGLGLWYVFYVAEKRKF